MRDGPRERGDRRNEEWVAHGVPPEEMDRLVREQARGRFAICAIVGAGESDAEVRGGFKSLGYRLAATEELMRHPLRRIPKPVAPADVQRVTTPALAERLARAARRRQILPEHLVPDAEVPLRAYVALSDGEIVGWVRSVVVGSSTWCSNMLVTPPFRRRGIGRALVSAALRDDRAAGARQSVLLASHVGAKLYPVLGYITIGTLLLFSPGKRR